MAINRQDSRHRIKRSTLTGVVPTVPPSTDFTDGTWLNTDIRAGEFFYNIPDQKLWIGTDTGSLEIPLIGGTMPTLSQVLSADNETGAFNIIMSDTQSITSGNFLTSVGAGGQLDLDYFGTPGEVSLSTDGGAQSESYLYLTPTTSDLVAGDGGSVGVGAGVNLNAATSNRIYIRGGATGVLIEGRYNSAGSGDIITFKDNFGSSITTSNNVKPGIIIGSQNSSINSATTNTVVIGGTGITGTASNTVYTPTVSIEGTTSSLILARLTTTQRDALTAVNGMLIYNTTTNKFQGYENGAWVNLI